MCHTNTHKAYRARVSVRCYVDAQCLNCYLTNAQNTIYILHPILNNPHAESSIYTICICIANARVFARINTFNYLTQLFRRKGFERRGLFLLAHTRRIVANMRRGLDTTKTHSWLAIVHAGS